MLAVLVEGRDGGECKDAAASLADAVRNDIIGNVSVIGPTPATISRIKDIYRFMIYARSKSVDELIRIKDIAEDHIAGSASSVRVSFDLDPMGAY